MYIIIQPLKAAIPTYRIEVRESPSAKQAVYNYPAVISILPIFQVLTTKLPRNEDHQIGWYTPKTGVQLVDFYLESAWDLNKRMPDFKRFGQHLKDLISGIMHFKPKETSW